MVFPIRHCPFHSWLPQKDRAWGDQQKMVRQEVQQGGKPASNEKRQRSASKMVDFTMKNVDWTINPVVFYMCLPSKNGDWTSYVWNWNKKVFFSMDYIWLEHHVHHIHGTYRYICWPCQENGTASSQALNTFAAWCSVAWFAKSLRCVTRNPWEDSEKEQVTFPCSLNFS